MWVGKRGVWSEEFFDFGELLAPIGPNFLGMQADHRIEAVRILAAEFENLLRRGKVDGRHKNLFYARLAILLNNGIEVVTKLFAIQVCVGVDHHLQLDNLQFTIMIS